jgi:CRP-like cAMP-binding protein
MLTETHPELGSRLASLAALGAPPRAVQTCGGAGLRADARVRNDLLAALSEEILARLRPRLERVDLKHKQVLYERNVPMPHAYFIERGAASLLSRSGERGAVEVGTLGRSDLVGIPIVLGTGRSPYRCVVQVPGEALRMSADDLKRALDELPSLRGLLLAYVQAVMVQGAQLVVCNTRHSLKERLARWLLVTQDRLDGDEIPLTHQSLGRAIGARRAGVTTTVGRMEEAGVVRRGRGRLTIVDRSALERTSCECYRAIRAEHRRILCPAESDAPVRGNATWERTVRTLRPTP